MRICKLLSVICPVYNEQKYIVQCIESILVQDFSKENLEVLFVDGMSSDETRQIISSYIDKYSFIRMLNNPERIVPYAMNIGILAAKGDVIMRLDAHAIYPSNYFSTLVDALYKLNADNVGAICRTDVLNKTSKTLAIREVLSNKFGVGNSVFRTGVNKVMEVDTVPFGCWKREVFDKYGLYDVRLVRNQDIELNKRILRGGWKICIIPDTYCTYLARENFKALSRNNYGNGKWNILTVFYTKQFDSLSLRHFIPLLFIGSLIIPTILSITYWPFMLLSLLSLLLYIVIIGAISCRLAITKRLNIFYLFVSFLVLHLSYGWGSLVGIIKLPFLR